MNETYRLSRFRPIAIGAMGVLCLVAIAIVRELLSTRDPILVVFILLWLGALAWNGYWFLFRMAYEIGITEGGQLHWRTVLSAHEVPLGHIENVKSPFGWFSRGQLRINVRDHTSPVLMTAPGFTQVAEALVRAKPDLSITTGWARPCGRPLGNPRRPVAGSAWWRRRELNPRPKQLPPGSLRACSGNLISLGGSSRRDPLLPAAVTVPPRGRGAPGVAIRSM